MVVDTIRFDPSTCTCGEHGCQPHYRIERKVRWVNEEEQEDVTPMKENEDMFVDGAEDDSRFNGKTGVEVNEHRCKEMYAADKTDVKTRVDEYDDELQGTDGDEKGDDGEYYGWYADRVYSEAGNGKRDDKVGCDEGDGGCDESLSGDKGDRMCDGRYDSDNRDGRFKSDTNGCFSGRTGIDENGKCDNRADSSKRNGFTSVDDEVNGDEKSGHDIDNERYKCKVDFEERTSRNDDAVMISEHNGRCVSGVDDDTGEGTFGIDDEGRCDCKNGMDVYCGKCKSNVVINESDGKCDGRVGVEFDEDKFDGSVRDHEVDDRGDDIVVDSRSRDHTLGVGSDPLVCANGVDDIDEISSAFGIMSIYCNSELHSCGRVKDKTNEK